jgi:hypothetical protein
MTGGRLYLPLVVRAVTSCCIARSARFAHRRSGDVWYALGMGLFKKTSTKPDAVKVTSETRGDGSQVVTTELALAGEPRPVRMDVVAALDARLGQLGGEVMHAMDPSRVLGFEAGGPPVWSVGIVAVPGPRPYSLLLTYGMSHVLSPEAFREGLGHEYSLAVPAGVPLSPWADALLRHQCRYVLTSGADIRVDDCVPFNGVPMSRIPFQPQHHAMMPDSSLVGIIATRDPVLGTIDTPAGPIEVRRLVGIDARELDRVETWSARGFVEEMARRDPLLVSPLLRPSLMADAAFRADVDRRAIAEGSEMDAAMFDIAWDADDGGVRVEVPCGAAAQRLLDGINGRIGHGRRLVAISRRSPPIELLPGAPGIEVLPRALRLVGDVRQGPIAAVVAAAHSGVGAHESRWIQLD